MSGDTGQNWKCPKCGASSLNANAYDTNFTCGTSVDEVGSLNSIGVDCLRAQLQHAQAERDAAVARAEAAANQLCDAKTKLAGQRNRSVVAESRGRQLRQMSRRLICRILGHVGNDLLGCKRVARTQIVCGRCGSLLRASAAQPRKDGAQ
jgi:ribosomal protein S27AE